MTGGSLINKLIFRGVGPLLPDKIRIPVRKFRNFVIPRNKARNSRGILNPGFAEQVSFPNQSAKIQRCQQGADPAHCAMHRLLPLGWNVRSKEVENRGLAIFNLEERDPFHDRQVVEFAFAIPEHQRSRNEGKFLLRQSLRGILPESIRQRNDKAEFSNVLANTLITQEVRSWLSCPRLVAGGYVNGTEVQRRYEEFSKMYSQGSIAFQHIWILWMAFIVEVWLSVLEK
jgi:hypothetical protein